jgi:hypothetical protein
MTMMSTRALRSVGAWTASGLIGVMACAGGETPTVSPGLAEDIATGYAGAEEPVGEAGRGGSASRGPATDDADGGAAEAGAAGASGAGGGRGGAAGAGSAGGVSAGGAPAGGASAGGTSAGAGGTEPACDGFAILATNCGSSGCHGDGSNLENFAASEADARAFVGSPGTLACVGQGDVIDTDDPAASLMITKLSDDPPCGQRMPVTGGALSESDIDCLEAWIGSL